MAAVLWQVPPPIVYSKLAFHSLHHLSIQILMKIQVGMHTEMIFPQKNVRLIAINDGVDSAQGENDFAPLRNIFNANLS